MFWCYGSLIKCKFGVILIWLCTNQMVWLIILSPLGFLKMVETNIFNFHIKNMNIFSLDEIWPKKHRCNVRIQCSNAMFMLNLAKKVLQLMTLSKDTGGMMFLLRCFLPENSSQRAWWDEIKIKSMEICKFTKQLKTNTKRFEAKHRILTV